LGFHIDNLYRSSHQRDARIVSQEVELPFKPVRFGQVVGVHARDIAAARRFNGLVHPDGKPALFSIGEDRYARVLEACNDIGGRICRAVIEKQELDVFSNPQASALVDLFGKDVEYIVFGVVTEYCVRLAAKGLLQRGRKVSIVKDAIETLKPEEGRHTLAELKSLGAELITTAEALAAVNVDSQKSAHH